MLTEAVKREPKNHGEGFMSGVFVLTASAIIVKIIGLVYKIPMLRLVGSEGMGYFNCAYEIYTLFCVVATSGLPVAMSMMISSAEASGKRSVKKIFSVAAVSFLILGFLGFAIMAAFSRSLSDFLKSERAFLCILAISPTVLFVCISSAYRGYFQGRGKMLPTAISQIIESAGKLTLGVLFALVALKNGYSNEKVAAFAVLGLSLGMALSALYLFLYKRFSNKRLPPVIDVDIGESRAGILSELVKIAIPVTLSSAVMSVTKLIDMTMILRRLQSIGYSSAEANSVYGSYTTLALPLFSLVPALISAVALPLVPALSAAISKNREDEQYSIISTALSITAIPAIPASLGLCFFSREILELIFVGENRAIEVSYPLLSLLGLSVLTSCMITVTNAVLQGYGLAHIPIISMLSGAAVKIALAYLLIGNHTVNIFGAPISTFFCNLAITLINFYFISKCAPRMPSVGEIFIKPFACALVSVGGAYGLMRLCAVYVGSGASLTLLAVLAAACIYLVLACLTGTLNDRLLAQMPGGGIIRRLLLKNNK